MNEKFIDELESNFVFIQEKINELKLKGRLDVKDINDLEKYTNSLKNTVHSLKMMAK